jgi:ketosteroid isomerase-like protein
MTGLCGWLWRAKMLTRLRRQLMKRLAVLFAVLSLALGASAQKAAKAPAKTSGGGAPDKAYMQRIWDGWASMDVANQKQYYAQGPHVFFDIAPLKYASWDEYQDGVTKVLSGFKAAKFTLNDDLQIHKCGDAYWVTSTVASDMTEKSGKRDMGQFRWTAVFEKHEGKWLIVHEHVSQPIS